MKRQTPSKSAPLRRRAELPDYVALGDLGWSGVLRGVTADHADYANAMIVGKTPFRVVRMFRGSTATRPGWLFPA